MSDERPPHDEPDNRYASTGERERRFRRERERRRLRRQRRLLTAFLVVIVAAGILVGSGAAERLWRRAVDHPAAGADGSGAAAPSSRGGPTAAFVSARAAVAVDPPPPIVAVGDGVKVSTFLGDETRRLYGLGPPPRHLDLLWHTVIGSGLSAGVPKKNAKPAKPGKPAKPPEPSSWSGTGWTGQPAILRDKGRLYLVVGGFDHNLHKIELDSGHVVWEYAFDDIIKSSPTVIRDPHPDAPGNRYLCLAGSRRGFPSDYTDPTLSPYRAVSFGTGKEVWRLPVPLTASYSRDVDGSGFFYKGRMYSGVESGWFYKLDPFRTRANGGTRKPRIVASRLLLGTPADAYAHGGNLVLEASPSLLGGIVYISSGAGHVYGMRRRDLKVVWDYRTGSDLDGTPVTTLSRRLLVAVEKQYIAGHGGVLKLDPTKHGAAAVDWFFPTGDRTLGDWEGGVIGSVAVNDTYDAWGRRPRLASFVAIDGYLYVVAQNALAAGTVPGPNLDGPYPTPRLLAKFWVGGGIGTPIMVDDTIIAGGYDGKVHLYSVVWRPAAKGTKGALLSPDGGRFTARIKETDTFAGHGAFESTPVMWKGRVFIGSRDGSLYCLGDR